MDVEINLVKSDNDVWGFRLTGGAEYDVPFIVVHVSEGGVAEKCGLQCHDVIESVNGTSIVGLIHNEAHKFLTTSGNNLVLGIKRGVDLVSPVTCDDESNEEVSNIMEPYLKDQEFLEHQRQVHFEIIDPSSNTSIPENVAEEETAVEKEITSESVQKQQERKWSTFLQKPKNPKPAPKNEETIKSEPYRVVIIKQPKKSSQPKAPEAEPQSKEPNEDAPDEQADVEEEQVEEVPEEETPQEEEPDKNTGDGEGEDHEDRSVAESVEDQEPQSNLSETQKEDGAVVDKLMEEKLAEIQKQLEALSKLPSNFQSTIDALNKQLALLVGVSSTKDEDERSEHQSDTENDMAEQTITEGSVKSMENEEQNENPVEGLEDTDNVEQEKPAEEEAPEDVNTEKEPTEEEKEAQRIEQELLEKQEKEKEQLEDFKQRRLKQKPTLPLKAVQRPIILPGGRRWSQPDDACPVVRHAKMSDEKIANTIETFSEVIVGKTKGLTIGTKYGRGPTKKRPFTARESINFMKYQPPPKNLDYLQRSDVYKLVHDLEPPLRGAISSRASKILAEQDYYQAG